MIIVILAIIIGFLLAERSSYSNEGTQAAQETATSTAPTEDLAKDADKATPGTKFSDGKGTR